MPILAWLVYPIYATCLLARHAGGRATWPRKIGTFVVLSPLLAVTSLLWGSLAYPVLLLCWFGIQKLLGH